MSQTIVNVVDGMIQQMQEYGIQESTVNQYYRGFCTARFLNKYERQITKINSNFLHLHPHLFRHTRAMHLYMAGMPLPLISEWLGHSQLETTTIYARATTDMKRKAAEKITTKENSVFKEETFKYVNNDDIIKQLYGLA